MTTVILNDMKTAVSLPDELFRQADELAKRLGVPRSQLYARALSQFVAEHSPSQVTAALDELYADADSSLDPNLARIQTSSIGDDEW